MERKLSERPPRIIVAGGRPSLPEDRQELARLQARVKALEGASIELLDAMVGQGSAGSVDSSRVDKAHGALHDLVIQARNALKVLEEK